MRPLRIAVIYATAGIAWIIGSDLFWRYSGLYAAMIKGSAFVLVTSALLYWLSSAFMHRIQCERRALADSERRLRQVVDNAPFGIFLEVDKRLEYVNPAAVRLLGASHHRQLLGQPLLNRVEPRFHPVLGQCLDLVTTRREPAPPADVVFLTLANQPVEVEVSAIPIVVDGRAGALVYFFDVTDRLHRERQFRSLAESLPAMVWIADATGNVRYLNHQWFDFTGQSAAQVENWMDAVHPADRARMQKAWQAAVAARSEFELRLRYRRSDGEYVWYLARALPIFNAGGELESWFGAAVNVHDPARLMESIQTAIENERLSLSRDLHDDLGQLLVSAKISIEFALRQCEAATPNLEKARQYLIACIQRTRDLAVMLRPVELDQVGLVAAIEHLLETFRQSSGIRCEFSCNCPGLTLPSAASILVYRFVQESLTNVAKHARATTVWLTLEHAGSCLLRVSVRDDGVGFDAAALTGKAGLGLVGMKERATALGASLEISSQPGKGTTVQLELATGEP
jgi:PAS domain S-box-containing protein